MTRHPATPWLLAAPALGLVALFLAGPLVLLARVSLAESGGGVGVYRPGTWSAHAYRELLGEPFGRRVVAFTALLGVAVAALAVLLAYPLALVIHGLPRRAKTAALAAVVLPKLANVFVVVYGLGLVLGSRGPVSRTLLELGLTDRPVRLTHGLAGVLVGETYLVLPYAVLVLVLALGRVDPALVAAARGLGAGPWAAFRRVTLPLSLPGVALAGQLALLGGLAAFVGPLLLGGPDQATLGVLVPERGVDRSDWPRAAAAAVLTLATAAACAAAYGWPARRLRRGGGLGDA